MSKYFCEHHCRHLLFRIFFIIQVSKIRAGIVGIERNIEKKQRETDKEVSQVNY